MELDLKNFLKVIIVLLAAGIFSIIYSALIGASPCILYGLAGIPCPACGVTRAVFSLFKGNIPQAFRYHPLFWYLAVIPLLSIKINKTGIKPVTLKKIYFCMTVVLCVVWLVRMVIYFPDVEPMIFNKTAIIPLILQQVF